MIIMGRVRAPFGVKGWVRVQTFTQQAQGLRAYPDWWLRDGNAWMRYRVLESTEHGGALVARLEGVEDRSRASALKGRDVAVPRAQLPEAEAGTYYWVDLIGLQVETTRGEVMGIVRSLLDTGGNAVLVVDGERERLLPFVEGVIRTVDVHGGRIVVDWELDY